MLLLLLMVVMRRGLASAARSSACCRACSRRWPASEHSISCHLCVALLQDHHAGLLMHDHSRIAHRRRRRSRLVLAQAARRGLLRMMHSDAAGVAASAAVHITGH